MLQRIIDLTALKLATLAVAAAGFASIQHAHAGGQAEEALSASVQASLQAAISDRAAPK